METFLLLLGKENTVQTRIRSSSYVLKRDVRTNQSTSRLLPLLLPHVTLKLHQRLLQKTINEAPTNLPTTAPSIADEATRTTDNNEKQLYLASRDEQIVTEIFFGGFAILFFWSSWLFVYSLF